MHFSLPSNLMPHCGACSSHGHLTGGQFGQLVGLEVLRRQDGLCVPGELRELRLLPVCTNYEIIEIITQNECQQVKVRNG